MSSREEELKAERDLLFQLAQSNFQAGFRKFPKFNRLLNKPDFEALRSSSKSHRAGCLLFFYGKNNGLSNSRIGLAITKKCGSAVIRNKIKRKIRELYRHSKITAVPFDFVVAVNTRKFNDLESWEMQKSEIVKGFQDFEEKFNF